MKAKLNLIIFSAVTTLAALIALFVIKNPVPISISKGFIVGDLGNKWILLCLLAVNIILAALNFAGKEKTPEQRAVAEKRQLYINIILAIWTIVVFFLVSMFSGINIVGASIYVNWASLFVIMAACFMSLFTHVFLKQKIEDMYKLLRLHMSVFVSQISGYVLIAVATINIFVDSIWLILPVLLFVGLCIYIIPIIISNTIKAKQQASQKELSEQKAKIESVINMASLSGGIKVTPEEEENANIPEGIVKEDFTNQEKLVKKKKPKKPQDPNKPIKQPTAGKKKPVKEVSSQETKSKPKAKQTGKQSKVNYQSKSKIKKS